MFDLQSAIAEWRKDLASGEQALSADELEELESHLRDVIDELERGGLPLDRAFAAAVQRLGPADELRAEFAKADPLRVWRARMFWVLMGMALTTAQMPCSLFHGRVVSAIHRLGVSGESAWLVAGIAQLPAVAIALLSAWAMLKASRLLPSAGDAGVSLARVGAFVGCAAALGALPFLNGVPSHHAFETMSELAPAQRFQYFRLAELSGWILRIFYAATAAVCMLWAAGRETELHRRVYWLAAGFLAFPSIGAASSLASNMLQQALGLYEMDPGASIGASLCRFVALCGSAVLLLVGAVSVGVHVERRTLSLQSLALVLSVTSLVLPLLSLSSSSAISMDGVSQEATTITLAADYLSVILPYAFFVMALVWSRRYADTNMEPAARLGEYPQ
jgi:hypothetical protein